MWLYRLLAREGGRGQRRLEVPRSPDGTRVTGDVKWAHDKKPLSPRSVQLVAIIVSRALRYAVEQGKLPVNPADAIPEDDRPTAPAKKHADRVWTPDEARGFLAHVADDRLHPLWHLALSIGARRGELAALRWSRVELQPPNGAPFLRIEANRVMVGAQVLEGTPKSVKSRRRVNLDAATVAVLERWRETQGLEASVAGEAWEGGDDPYVFTNELGRALHPDAISNRFEAAQRGAEVPRIPMHGLRHTAATLALKAGVPVHVVSDLLGHSSVSVTWDVYGHVLEDQRSDAADAIGAQLAPLELEAEG